MAEVLQEVPGFPDEAPQTEGFRFIIPKIAAKTASTVVPGIIIPQTGAVYSATYSTLAAIGESATEYATYEVITFKANGTEVGVAASFSTKKPVSGTAALAAKVAQPLTLSATPTNLLTQAGGFVLVKVTGTEMKEDTGGVLVVKLARNVRETPKEQPGV